MKPSYQFSRIVLPVPHLMQQAKADCLAACAAMVLGYTGRIYNYRKLTSALDIRSHGAVFSHILRLDKLGINFTLKTGGFNELHNLLRQNHPCILAVRTGELAYWRDLPKPEDVSHAIVLIGLAGDTAYVNDPAFEDAPFTVSIGELDLARLEHDERFAFLA
ncbi:MAG: papain-like cysteine protease family protein [Caldilineaceae bacterium]